MPHARPPATCHPDRPHLARGFCESCYRRWWNQQNPERYEAAKQRRRKNAPPRPPRGCSVEGCPNKHNSHGLCAKHGLRLARNGDVHNPGAFTYSKTGRCTHQGCTNEHVAKGLCVTHYQRARSGRLALPELLTCARCSVQFPRPYKGNPEAVRFCSHECRYANQLDDHRAHRAERSAYLREWTRRNPEAAAAIRLRRKAAKRTQDLALVTGKDLARLVRRHCGFCAYCGERPYKHFDHVIPLSRGGRHAIGNLLPACARCNLTKGARFLADWRLRPPLPRRFRGATAS